MFGRSDGQGWLNEDDWDLPDPDLVEDSLATLSVFTDSVFDVIWQHLITYDADEILKNREMMKMQLARYAKQDLHKWDNIEVSEIRRWWFHLKEIISEENMIQSATED